jgi:putative endonuclease
MTTKSNTSCWYVYIVRCKDQTLYTGIARDIEKRLAQHNSGRGARYTRGRAPVELVFVEAMLSHGDALRREYKIKQMSLSRKLEMIEDCDLARSDKQFISH